MNRGLGPAAPAGPGRRPGLAVLLALLLPLPAAAASIADATGRVVSAPDRIERILPANAAAAVLLSALAPNQMLGWPGTLPEPGRAGLAEHAASLPVVPDLSAGADVPGTVRTLRPDLIVQYGLIGPAEVERVRQIATRSGVPTVLLDGSLHETPHALRLLGTVLHRSERAEALAALAEAMLAMCPPGGGEVRVLYAHGTDGAGSAPDAAGVFAALGWTVMRPDPGGGGPAAQAAKLDPDVIVFADAAMRDAVQASPAWRAVRAVRTGHAFVEPVMPFGWLGRPASINRLLGLAWLSGADPVTAAAMFDAAAYGTVLTAPQQARLRVALRPLSLPPLSLPP